MSLFVFVSLCESARERGGERKNESERERGKERMRVREEAKKNY